MQTNATINSDQIVQTLNAEHQQETTAIMENNRSFIKKLFPTQFQRVLDDHRLKQANTELEFRERALSIAKEAQLQAIQETYNHCLVQGKGGMRKERAGFFAEQARELEQEINRITSVFYSEIERQYVLMEKLTVPFLRQKEQHRLEASVTRYSETVERLLQSFSNILSEEIQG